MTAAGRSSAELLPGVFREQVTAEAGEPSLLGALMSAFDEALAPVLLVLDNQPAHLDPSVAPPAALRWLTAWLGLVTDETRPLDTRRRVVADAGALYALQGTADGLQRQVGIALGAQVQVVDNGGVSWSSSPAGPFAEREAPHVVVRLTATTEEPPEALAARARAVVRALTPAGVGSEVELTS